MAGSRDFLSEIFAMIGENLQGEDQQLGQEAPTAMPTHIQEEDDYQPLHAKGNNPPDRDPTLWLLDPDPTREGARDPETETPVNSLNMGQQQLQQPPPPPPPLQASQQRAQQGTQQAAVRQLTTRIESNEVYHKQEWA
jgi:hypothetical protein